MSKPVIRVVWDADGSYRVGPATIDKRGDCLFDRRFSPSRCRSRLAARQAVTRWQRKTGATFIHGIAILEGR